MKNLWKRIASFLLALCLVAGYLPLSVLAEEAAPSDPAPSEPPTPIEITFAGFVDSPILGEPMLQWTDIGAASYDLAVYTEAGVKVHSNVHTSNYVKARDVLPYSGTFYFAVAGDAPGYGYSGLTSNVFTYTDVTPPTVYARTSQRTGASQGTVSFDNRDKLSSCVYYYAVVESGAEAPAVDTSGEGFPAAAGTNTIPLTDLPETAQDVYVVVKDQDGNASAPLKITVPAYEPYYVRIFTTVSNYGTTTDLGGTITGDGPYLAGQTVTLTATPNEGYCAIAWGMNGNAVELPVGTSPEHFTISFKMPAQDIQITGSFHPHSYSLTALEDGKNHVSQCWFCGDIQGDPLPHVDGDGDECCDECFYDWHVHTLSDTYNTDETMHWRACLTCGHEYAEYGEHAYGPGWSSDETAHFHGCVCGLRQDEAAHLGGSATCTEQAKCAVCAAPYGERKPHTYGTKWFSDGENHWHECACGEKSNVAAHSGGEATCTQQAKCAVCAASYGSLDPHTPAVILGYDPTCEAPGLTDGQKCGLCGEILKAQEEIPATGHTEVVFSPGYDASCTYTGRTPGTMCSVCTTVLEVQQETPMLPHTEAVFPGYNATCTTPGLTDGQKCAVCGEILKDREEIPAPGHTEEILPGRAPTCTVPGLTEGKKCSICGNVTVPQEEIPAPGHTSSGPATEEKAETCTVCNEVLTPALPHTHVYGTAWVTDGENHWRECACGEKSDVTAHSGGTATCIAQALCSACGVSYGDKKDHTFSDAWTTDDTHHWHQCTLCPVRTDYLSHKSLSSATEESAELCYICGYEMSPKLPHTHKYTTQYDADGHWTECACNEKTGKVDHSYGYACTAKCSGCGYERLVTHVYTLIRPATNGKEHILFCIHCGSSGGTESHEFEEVCDPVCDICGHERTVSHTYEWRTDAEGHIESCKDCIDIKTPWAPHTSSGPATAEAAEVCTVCGYEIAPKREDFILTIEPGFTGEGRTYSIPGGTVVDLSDYWPEALTWNDYYFQYFRNEDGTSVYSLTMTGDISLEEVWGYAYITVTFDPQGGTLPYSKARIPFNNNFWHVYNDHVPVREGYVFMGWTREPGVPPLDYEAQLADQDCTLYALWAETRTLTLTNGDASRSYDFAHGTVVDLRDYWPENLTNSRGQHFDYFTPGDGTPVYILTMTQDITLEEVWRTDPTFTLTLDPQGGTLPYSKVRAGKTSYATLNSRHIPTRKGFRFLSWSLEPNVLPEDLHVSVIKEDCTLYAVWEEDLENQHTVSPNWSYDENIHYHECSCGERHDEGAHRYFLNSAICTTCGYLKGFAIGPGTKTEIAFTHAPGTALPEGSYLRAEPYNVTTSDVNTIVKAAYTTAKDVREITPQRIMPLSGEFVFSQQYTLRLGDQVVIDGTAYIVIGAGEDSAGLLQPDTGAIYALKNGSGLYQTKDFYDFWEVCEETVTISGVPYVVTLRTRAGLGEVWFLATTGGKRAGIYGTYDQTARFYPGCAPNDLIKAETAGAAVGLGNGQFLVNRAGSVMSVGASWANNVTLLAAGGNLVTGNVSGTLTASGLLSATSGSALAAHLGTAGTVELGSYLNSRLVFTVTGFSPFILLDVTEFEIPAIPLTDVPVETYVTVTFDPNGGKLTTTTALVARDGKLPSLPTPKRDNYQFIGWYTTKTGGTKVSTDTLYGQDTTLYAHWIYRAPDSDSPKTGDTTHTILWLTLALTGLAGVTLTLTAKTLQRKRK